MSAPWLRPVDPAGYRTLSPQQQAWRERLTRQREDRQRAAVAASAAAPWLRPVDPAGYPTVPTQEAVMRARIAGDPYTAGALLWSLNGPGADHLTQALTNNERSEA